VKSNNCKLSLLGLKQYLKVNELNDYLLNRVKPMKKSKLISDLFSNLNVAKVIEESMKKYSTSPAYSCFGHSISFAEVDKKSAALASYLLEVANLNYGDRVVVQLPNLMQHPIAAFAVLRAGLILVNANPQYTAREIQHQVTNSGAKAIILLEDYLPVINTFVNKTSIETIVTTQMSNNFLNESSGILNHEEVNEVRKTIDFSTAITQGNRFTSINRKNITGDDIAAIQYTGGTTGVAKGATLTHKNLLSNINQVGHCISSVFNNNEEIFVTPLPLYHIYAFVNSLLMFCMGNKNVLITDPRNIDTFAATLADEKPTGLCGINTLFLALCNHPKITDIDFSKLKLTLSGGAALTTTASNTWKNITHCTISEGYGLSETSPVVTLNPPGQEQVGTIGLPVINTEVELWDGDGVPVTNGESGEIVVRGPQVMMGYWQNMEETNQVLINGWFKTGDIAVKQNDGFFRIVDRKKDMIIVSGFNVYPNEVENILMSHGGVLEAAVVGESCEKSGEKVSAFIVKSGKITLTESDITVHCKEQLTAYKIPKKITFLDELPKSSVGKILRKDLRKI
jgi:long-chain acyl-CoA synthetase